MERSGMMTSEMHALQERMRNWNKKGEKHGIKNSSITKRREAL